TWIQAALQSPFKPFHDFSKTLVTWKTHILAYFRLPYTNARTEGINHKIKNLKRRAYGYRNRERFRLRVKLECGCFQQDHSLLHFASA
ncbi:transposase, partial [Caldalkalibacillus thermarum]|uniref:transposase n=1 Tax=Caldalkalibacillus thermarum TaxID=296745 RepID=UPI0016653AE7